MVGFVRVDHKEGDRFEIEIRQHVLSVDQTAAEGGRTPPRHRLSCSWEAWHPVSASTRGVFSRP